MLREDLVVWLWLVSLASSFTLGWWLRWFLSRWMNRRNHLDKVGLE